jgi:hypothetical protein
MDMSRVICIPGRMIKYNFAGCRKVFGRKKVLTLVWVAIFPVTHCAIVFAFLLPTASGYGTSPLLFPLVFANLDQEFTAVPEAF